MSEHFFDRPVAKQKQSHPQRELIKKGIIINYEPQFSLTIKMWCLYQEKLHTNFKNYLKIKHEQQAWSDLNWPAQLRQSLAACLRSLKTVRLQKSIWRVTGDYFFQIPDQTIKQAKSTAENVICGCPITQPWTDKQAWTISHTRPCFCAQY